MPLIYVTHHDGYPSEFSEYVDNSTSPATTVFVMDREFGAKGVAPRGLDIDNAVQMASDRSWNFETFESHLMYASDATEWFYCDSCAEVESRDGNVTIDGETVCESCADGHDYAFCNRCEEHKTIYVRVGTDYDENPDYVCGSCEAGWTSWCNYCDVRYWDSNAEYHDHAPDPDDEDHTSGCCEAAKRSFSIPLVGLPLGANGVAPTLHNDERFEVSLDRDEVTYTGQNAIVTVLDAYYTTTHEGARVGGTHWYAFRQWITRNGWMYKTDRGTYARRLRSAIYNESKAYNKVNVDHPIISLPADVLEKVGQIAREFSTPKTFDIEITRDLNQSRSAFAHDGSCWWTEYAHSRCTLKSNGGFGPLCPVHKEWYKD